jgi:hypothetical protein
VLTEADREQIYANGYIDGREEKKEVHSETDTE